MAVWYLALAQVFGWRTEYEDITIRKTTIPVVFNYKMSVDDDPADFECVCFESVAGNLQRTSWEVTTNCSLFQFCASWYSSRYFHLLTPIKLVKLISRYWNLLVLCWIHFQNLLVQCGKPNVKVNEFPWMAHILVRNPSGRLLTCGGTLISAEHIITAAHCLIEDGSDRVFRILNITLGARDVSPDSNERIHRQVFNWKVLTVPEIHNNITGHNIAIVALSKPAILNGLR